TTGRGRHRRRVGDQGRRCSRCRQHLVHQLLSRSVADAPAPTEIYTLSLHDALPIFCREAGNPCFVTAGSEEKCRQCVALGATARSEEHTSELQSPYELVCRLLLEKKKTSTPADTAPPASPSASPSPTPSATPTPAPS